MTSGLLLRNVEIGGRRLDVRTRGAVIVEIGPALRGDGATDVVEGHGGALLPGLHDHHIHLLATAAARRSVAAGPPEVRNRGELQQAMRRAPAGRVDEEWVRAVGYHESVAGALDRHDLDILVPDRPLRLQHRGGALWMLNSLAIDRLALDDTSHPGIERDATGQPTGRLHRADDLLRRRPGGLPPGLRCVGELLAGYGVTGATDATPYQHAEDLLPLVEAVRSGAIPQRVVVTGGPALAGLELAPELGRGPVKLVVDDSSPPDIDGLAAHISLAHAAGRAVAVHCVTRIATVLALAAWDQAGSRAGDRIEHGSVIPAELVEQVRRHGLTVVTQPGLVAERGDDYRREVDDDDQPHLYRCRSLLEAGVPVAGSTDAPYTDADPWRAMRAAVQRRTPGGITLGRHERIRPRRALELFLGDAQDPGRLPRKVEVGAAADLCLLHVPLAVALARLTADDVAAAICAGNLAGPAAIGSHSARGRA